MQNPPLIRKPHEPGYELPIEGETDTQIRDRNLRNPIKRVKWENQSAQCPVGGSRHQMPKLHVPLFGGRGPKKSNTILPRSKYYDQRFL